MSEQSAIVELRSATVRYGQGSRAVCALRDVTLTIRDGEFVTITGPSGSGKTTLLNAIAGLEPLSSGEVFVLGRSLAAYNDRELAALRRRTLAYVFQFFGLLPMLTVDDNVAIPLRAERMPKADIDHRVSRALEAVGLGDRRDHLPDELSGGEMQRVAIARALATDARLILADEPTGNLDQLRTEEVLDLLRTAVDEHGRSVLLVTHNMYAAGYGDRMITLRDGRIEDEISAKGELAEIIPIRERT